MMVNALLSATGLMMMIGAFIATEMRGAFGVAR